jgi:hypothetical protein
LLKPLEDAPEPELDSTRPLEVAPLAVPPLAVPPLLDPPSSVDPAVLPAPAEPLFVVAHAATPTTASRAKTRGNDIWLGSRVTAGCREGSTSLMSLYAANATQPYLEGA